MNTSLTVLDRKAVKAALNQEWQSAVELNTQILQINPKDIDAKLRLGKAHLQLKNFSQAKKCFKEVLEFDPIHQVAKKNYDLASKKKADKEQSTNIKEKSIIKEPGTTHEYFLEILDKKVKVEDLEQGEELEFKVLKTATKLLKQFKKDKKIVAEFDKQASEKLYNAKEDSVKLKAKYIGHKGAKINVLVVASKPIFKGQKQEVKPYTKQSTTDED